MIQGTEDWHAARLGKITASRTHDAVTKLKSGSYSAARANYMAELICEILTGQRAEGFTNAAMQWGTDHEPQARAMYTLMTGLDVQEVGFVDHSTLSGFGASPDGLVGELGLVEIKCPNTATHIDRLLGANIDPKYQTQMQVQMMCTGRVWCDFVSFDPRLPADMQISIERVEADHERQREIADEVEKFTAEMADKIDRLKAVAEAA